MFIELIVILHPQLAVDCGELDVPVNGSLQGSSTSFPNVMMFECDEGFILYGSKHRVCQSNRTWSGMKARCVGNVQFIMTNTLFTMFNGIYLSRHYSYLVLMSIKLCSVFCALANDCGFLGVPMNGSIIGEKTSYPSSIRIICDEGFDLFGSSIRVCTSNGTWSGTNSSCEGKPMVFIDI